MSRRQGKMPGDPQPRLHLPFTSQYVDDADLSYTPGETSTDNSRPQPISSPPRPTTSSGGYLSSSFTRTPARSFYHQATHGSIGMHLPNCPPLSLQPLTNSYADTPEYSSQGVRDKTQELSMHALSESGSFRSPSVLAHRLSAAGSPRGRRPPELVNDTFDLDAGRDVLELPPSGIIEEESEPSSPEPLREAVPRRFTRPVSSAGGRPSSASAANGEHHRDPRRSTDDRRGLSETSSLLPNKRPQSRKHYGSTTTDVEDQRHGLGPRPAKFWTRVSGAAHSAVDGFHRATNPKSWDREAIFQAAVVEPVSALPAVFLGLLLNVLDGLSYGECSLYVAKLFQVDT